MVIVAGSVGRARAGRPSCQRTLAPGIAGSGLTFQDRGTHELKGVPANGGYPPSRHDQIRNPLATLVKI
jgi:hypothetical protein